MFELTYDGWAAAGQTRRRSQAHHARRRPPSRIASRASIACRRRGRCSRRPAFARTRGSQVPSGVTPACCGRGKRSRARTGTWGAASSSIRAISSTCRSGQQLPRRDARAWRHTGGVLGRHDVGSAADHHDSAGWDKYLDDWSARLRAPVTVQISTSRRRSRTGRADVMAEGSTEQVVAHVRGLIERGSLRPGDRLPAERDLALADRREPPDGARRPARARGDGRRPVAPRLGHLHSRRPADARQRAAQLSRGAARLHARGDVRGAAHSRSRRRRPRGRARDARAARVARRGSREPVRVDGRSAAVPRARHQLSTATSPPRPAIRSSRRSSRWCRRSTTSGGARRPSARRIAICATPPKCTGGSTRRSARATPTRRGARCTSTCVQASRYQAQEPTDAPVATRRPATRPLERGRPRAGRRREVPELALMGDRCSICPAGRPSSSAARAASAARWRSAWPTPAPTSSPRAGASPRRRGRAPRSKRAAAGRCAMACDVADARVARAACATRACAELRRASTSCVVRRGHDEARADARHDRRRLGAHHRRRT